MGEIDWRVLFLSPHGRLARAPFWLAAAILIVVLVLYESAVSVALHWVTGWIFYPVMVFCGACVLSKRLHDRGRSGSVGPQVDQLGRVRDVDLGELGEGVAQAVTVMVKAEAERHHAVRGNIFGQAGPGHFGQPPLRVLEAHVQRGEVLEGPGRRVSRDAPRAVGDPAARLAQVLH